MSTQEKWHRDQIDYWNGRAGSYWASTTEVLDRAFARMGDAALQKAAHQPGEKVLDVGCGAGTTSRAIANAVAPNGNVLGVDVSAPLIEDAKRRSQGISNIEFRCADAASLTFDVTYDALFSRFGVMFFGDPTAAFTNLNHALRRGGRLTFVCWRPLEENPWSVIPFDAACSVLGTPQKAPPEAPGPHAFADRDRVSRILTDAGFNNVIIEPHDDDIVLAENGLEEAVDFAMNRGPASRMLVGVEDDARATVAEAVTVALRPYVSGKHVTLQGATWVVRACRP